jgi:peptidoglycan hydrolase-like protein with peptidoglycan-binding domain
MNTNTKKIIAGLLSFAMVLTLVAGVAVSTVDAQTASFSRNLTVGSRGTDVSALQSILASKGFLSVAPTGYFGSLTRAALAAYQAANGITPAAGYFGPITRAQITVGGPVACTPGTFDPQTGQPCSTGTPGCPAGAVYNYMTGARCDGTGQNNGGTLDNTDGSITVTESSTVGDGAQLKKGETKNVLAAEFNATAGKVSVTRFDVRIDVRPWLYFNKIELKNSSGAVIATKNISGASDFTELTSGSDYLLRFDGLNLVVTPGTRETITISASVLPSTDKLTSNVNDVTFSVPAGSIRTLNGKGYTDSIGGSISNDVDLLSTGTDGVITARVAATAKPSEIVTTSITGQTNEVELIQFELRSANTSSTVQGLTFTMQNNTGGATSSASVFKSVKLYDGSTLITSTTSATTTAFTNLNIQLAADTYKTLSVKVDVADQDEFFNGLVASTTLTTVDAYDIDYTDNDATSLTVTGRNITLMSTGVAVSAVSATAATVNDNSTAAQSTLSFTLTNNSTDTVYIPRLAGTLFGTSTTAGPTSTSWGSVSASGTYSSDTSTYYIIPAGAPRTFTVLGVLSDSTSGVAIYNVKVDRIYFDDDTTGLQEFQLTTGLDNLKIEAAF